MSLIIIPSKKIIEPKDPLRVLGEVQGWFKIEALKVDAHGRVDERSRRVVADWFPNLITNFGLNNIGANTNSAEWCRVGSGNATPQFTDTQLQSQVASSNTLQADVEVNGGTPPNYFHGRNLTYRFATGVAAGNLSEVGIGTSTSGANLFSRALILDGALNPTTITILSDEVLDVTYQSRWYPPNADQEYNITVTGVGTVGVTARACRVTATTAYRLGSAGVWTATSGTRSFNGVIGAVTGSPSGTTSPSTSNANAAYSANSFQRNFTTTYGLNNGNLAGGITAMEVSLGNTSSCYGTMQYGFSPAIPKVNTQILTINGTHSWARR